MNKLFLIIPLILVAGCATLELTTTTLPSSGRFIDIVATSYNNPLTQDLSAMVFFDDKGNPIAAANTGGPGILKSLTANSTAGAVASAVFPADEGDTSTNVNQPSATGGEGGRGGKGGAGGNAAAIGGQGGNALGGSAISTATGGNANAASASAASARAANATRVTNTNLNANTNQTNIWARPCK